MIAIERSKCLLFDLPKQVFVETVEVTHQVIDLKEQVLRWSRLIFLDLQHLTLISSS